MSKKQLGIIVAVYVMAFAAIASAGGPIFGTTSGSGTTYTAGTNIVINGSVISTVPLARLGSNDTVTGSWTFSGSVNMTGSIFWNGRDQLNIATVDVSESNIVLNFTTNVNQKIDLFGTKISTNYVFIATNNAVYYTAATGTVNVQESSTAVTGTGTQFTTEFGTATNFSIKVNSAYGGDLGFIASITDDSNLVLAVASGFTDSGVTIERGNHYDETNIVAGFSTNAFVHMTFTNTDVGNRAEPIVLTVVPKQDINLTWDASILSFTNSALPTNLTSGVESVFSFRKTGDVVRAVVIH